MKFTAITILSVAGAAVAATTSSNTTDSTPASNATTSTTGYGTTTPSTSSSSSSSGSSFQIPSGISPGCSTFLTSLDQSPAIASCVSVPALSGTGSPSLSTVCGQLASSTCSESAYYSFLTYFAGNCTAELVTAPNADVTAIYDSLYVALPFQKAVCTKDTTTNNWCASGSKSSNATSTSSTGTAGGVANAAQAPLSTSDGYPNPDAFEQSDILFLGYNSNMDASSLCTPCLQKILVTYFGHESTRPYPAGLSASPLMSVQSDLWAAVQSKCPSDFVTTAVANAGASPSTAINAAPVLTPARSAVAILALVAGVLAL